MDRRNDFTYDRISFKGLPQFIKELHQRGMHYIPLIDPGVSGSEKPGTYPPFDKGIEMDIFIKNTTGQPFIGKVLLSSATKCYQIAIVLLVCFVLFVEQG